MTINNDIINNSKLKFHSNNKFCIFSADQFLTQDFYNNIEKSFPKFEEFFNEQKTL